MNVLRKKTKILVIVLICISGLVILLTNTGGLYPSPDWNGITPGVSSKEDVVIVLGEPDEKIETLFGYQSVFRYGKLLPDSKLQYHLTVQYEVYFKFGTVDYIKENLIDWWEGSNPTLLPEELFDVYGPPEKVEWSKISPHYSAVLYCDQGIIAHGNENYIAFIYYFVPQSQMDCTRKFREDIPILYPFWDTDIIRTNKDPWGWSAKDK